MQMQQYISTQRGATRTCIKKDGPMIIGGAGSV
jgi:hypothetical protein